MSGRASKFLLLTLLPVLALGAPYSSSSSSAQATVTVTVTDNACGVTSSSSTSNLPTSTIGSTSSSTPTSSTMPTSGIVPTSPSSDISAQPTQNACGQWVVDGTGTFANKTVFTFNGSTLPSGLSASNYQVDDRSGGAPYNHVFKPANVVVSDGFLNLNVPGGQKPTSKTAISSAEITTNMKIQYGSVRTNAIFSTVPGTCHGTFFYQGDTQEIDIEYLTDPTSTSNPGGQDANLPPPLQYLNQATHAGGEPTYETGNPPANVTAVHEYRIDWTSAKTMFFLDGVLQKTFTTNVPTTAGPWVWNNWSNGDGGWTVGPPAQDNVFKIKDITMYYNVPSQSS